MKIKILHSCLRCSVIHFIHSPHSSYTKCRFTGPCVTFIHIKFQLITSSLTSVAIHPQHSGVLSLKLQHPFYAWFILRVPKYSDIITTTWEPSDYSHQISRKLTFSSGYFRQHRHNLSISSLLKLSCLWTGTWFAVFSFIIFYCCLDSIFRQHAAVELNWR